MAAKPTVPGLHGELPGGEKRDPLLFKNLADATPKPVLAFGRSTYSCTDESRAFQDQAGLPFLQAIKPTLRALAGLGLYGERLQRGVPKLPPRTGSAADLSGENLDSLLRKHGIGLPKQALAGTAADAAAKAKEIGFPVAIKLIAAEVVHKTESGAVVLNLRNAEEVQEEA